MRSSSPLAIIAALLGVVATMLAGALVVSTVVLFRQVSTLRSELHDARVQVSGLTMMCSSSATDNYLSNLSGQQTSLGDRANFSYFDNLTSLLDAICGFGADGSGTE